jgi:general secretion pathway protein A
MLHLKDSPAELERMLEFYGFAELPFSISPDPRFLYHTSAHLAAFQKLRQNLVQLQGLSVVCGAVGSGKSTIARRLLEELLAPELERVYHSILVKNASNWTTSSKMIRGLCEEFGLPPRRSEDAQWMEFETYVARRAVDDAVNVVILVDEAQNLPRKVLVRLRELLNFEANHRKFVQVALFGTMDLWEQLQDPVLRPLRSRIAGGPAFLKPLGLDEMTAAIQFRSSVAGRREPLFEDSCFPIIQDCSAGNIRTAVDICRESLTLGLAEEESPISSVTVELASESVVPGPEAATAAGA